MLEVILLVGAPGSGKSTWGEKYAADNGMTYLSSDKNRARLGTGEEDQSVSARAFALLKTEMNHALQNEKNVVIDATFMSIKARKEFVAIARLHNAHLRAVVFELLRETILSRNKRRADAGGRNVPEDVIDKMLDKYQRPDKPEFDEVTFIK